MQRRDEAIDDGKIAHLLVWTIDAVDDARMSTAPFGVGAVGSSCEWG